MNGHLSGLWKHYEEAAGGSDTKTAFEDDVSYVADISGGSARPFACSTTTAQYLTKCNNKTSKEVEQLI